MKRTFTSLLSCRQQATVEPLAAFLAFLLLAPLAPLASAQSSVPLPQVPLPPGSTMVQPVDFSHHVITSLATTGRLHTSWLNQLRKQCSVDDPFSSGTALYVTKFGTGRKKAA
jgi:hypothetical protein